MNLSDKAIVVTGSTTGIGEAIARRCVAHGARVLVHGRDKERGESIAAELGQAACFHQDDLLDPGSPARIVDAAVKAFGRLDGLVNNAGYVVRNDLDTGTVDLFDRIMAINVRAPAFLIKAARPHLIRSEGSIVNIGSVNAYCGEARQLFYSVSKAGLMTLSRNLANVLAIHKVRVTHFNVGWVLTPNEYELKRSEGLPEDFHLNPDPRFVPSGEMTSPENIATHAVFWLSDESRPISGSVMELEQFPIIGTIDLKEGE